MNLSALIPPELRLMVFGGLASAVLLGGIVAVHVLRAQGAAAERPRTEAQAVRADKGELEAAGERAAAARVETHRGLEAAIARTVRQVQSEAGAAPDAQSPLDLDRARRLRAGDDELCRLRPALCAAAPGEPAAGDAGGRPGAVRALPPAGGADAG